MDFNHLFTSFDGRISRQPYWIGVLVMIVVAVVASILLAMVLGASTQAFLIGSFLLQLALLYPGIALLAKRLHDRNRPTYWAAFILAPSILQGLFSVLGLVGDPLNPNALDYLLSFILIVVGIWFLIELGFLRGTVGPNQYGPDPLEGQP